MAERYAAHLRISRVTTTTSTERRVTQDDGKRKVETVDLTVRAPSLEKLITKIDAHLALVDGDDFEDAGIHAVTR